MSKFVQNESRTGSVSHTGSASRTGGKKLAD